MRISTGWGRPRRHLVHKATISVTALSIVLALAACGSSTNRSDEDGAMPTDISVLVQANQPVFDQWQGGVATQGVTLLVNEPLIRYDGETFQPNLAESFDQPSPTQYVYTLRSGVQFTDGSPVTAEDVRYTLETATRDDHVVTTYVVMSSIEDIQIDGAEIVVNLDSPQPLFQYAMARTGIVSKAFYEKNGDLVGTPSVGQVGSGPYRLRSFQPTEMVVEKNPEYWGVEGAFNSITFTIVADDSARFLALQSGEANAIFEIPVAQVDAIAAIDGFSVSDLPDSSFFILQMDVRKKPFDDPKVRDAVRHAINREALLDAVFNGNGIVAETLSPAANLSLVADEASVESTLAGFAEQNRYDPDLAKQLMAESTVPGGFDVELPVESVDQNVNLIAQSIVQDLAQIGIEVTLDPRGDDYVNVLLDKDSEGLTLNQFSTNAPDPSMPMGYFLPIDSPFNLTQQDLPEAMTAFGESRTLAVDDPERGKLLLDSLTALQDGGAVLPLAFPDMSFGMKAPMEVLAFTNYWWMQRWDLLVTD